MREKITGRRKLNNKDVRNLYSSPDCYNDDSKKGEMDGPCSTHENDEKYIHNFGRKI
jgi:hypothetical protein